MYGLSRIVTWKQVCLFVYLQVRGKRNQPLDFFLPRPSLSTTSLRHCTDRPFDVECAPRSRKMAGAEVSVWVWAGAAVVWLVDGCAGCACRWATEAIVIACMCFVLVFVCLVECFVSFWLL